MNSWRAILQPKHADLSHGTIWCPSNVVYMSLQNTKICVNIPIMVLYTNLPSLILAAESASLTGIRIYSNYLGTRSGIFVLLT
jgi:hypothetical protein